MPDFKNIVLLSFSHWENPKKPGTGYEIQVVHEIMDNKSMGVGVQKVYFYQDGTKTIGKIIKRKDFSAIKENWPKILALMDNPPPVPEVQPVQSDTIEEVPF